jgi:hypothetical protein
MGAQCPREAIQAIGERRELLELRMIDLTKPSHQQITHTERKALTDLS